MVSLNDNDESLDDKEYHNRTVPLDDLEPDDDNQEEESDWGDGFDDMDSESWDRQYGDEEEELEVDPWELS